MASNSPVHSVLVMAVGRGLVIDLLFSTGHRMRATVRSLGALRTGRGMVGLQEIGGVGVGEVHFFPLDHISSVAVGDPMGSRCLFGAAGLRETEMVCVELTAESVADCGSQAAA